MTSATPELVGKAALVSQVGNRQFRATWTSDSHRARRLLAEFIGTFGLMFVLSAGAAILAKYGGGDPPSYVVALVLSSFAALWLLLAILFLGDMSSHFNPAMTLAFALRRDMGWTMAIAYWVVQCVAAIAGALLAKWFFGPMGNLAATRPPAGLEWSAVAFEALLTFGLVLMVLGMANGPKLDGPYVPFAVAAYIMALGSLGGPFEGAAMNPARALGPDVALADLSTYWVYLVGPFAGAALAVGAAYVLRGPAKSQEAIAAMGDPTATE
ncbi:MAG: aquaporin [Actinobacteria bacterium]|nr:aquaporin [Actinomycetota bacterium]